VNALWVKVVHQWTMVVEKDVYLFQVERREDRTAGAEHRLMIFDKRTNLVHSGFLQSSCDLEIAGQVDRFIQDMKQAKDRSSV